jgi:DNA-binding sugar fermentation-stimulating protein
MKARNQRFYMAVRKYFRRLYPLCEFSYEVPCGNCRLDMVVKNGDYKIAIEIKNKRDDIQRGLAELCTAKAYGYDECILVTIKTKALKVDKKTLQFYRFKPAYINSKNELVFCE